MDTPQAQKTAAAIVAEWKVLASYLEAAHDGEAWVALGYETEVEWLGDLLEHLRPTPTVCLLIYQEVALPSPPTVTRARVSQPGKTESTRPGRPARSREVQWRHQR